MIYRQNTDFCLSGFDFSPGELDALQEQGVKILQTIRADVAAGRLPIISIASQSADLAEIEALAGHIRDNFSTLVILGTGGSALCGHALAGFMQSQFGRAGTRVVFMENIDPRTFEHFFANTDLKRTAFLTISKSGSSVETLMQLLVCLEQARGLEINRHFFAIAEPGNNLLRRVAAQYNTKVLQHNPDIGGRFSILSLVGLIPGLVAGLEARGLRQGADDFFKNYADYAVESAVIHVALMRKGIWQNVLMTYPDRLKDFNIWYRQIWAESIGKNGTGSTPINASGVIDQHSQMQLYLAGRRDKFYNFITLQMLPTRLKAGDNVDTEYLNSKSLSDLINAEQRATIQTLCDSKHPVRVIELQELNEAVFGGLIMHAMLETIITAYLLGVNPYDQPAVEAGKVLTRKIMAGI